MSSEEDDKTLLKGKPPEENLTPTTQEELENGGATMLRPDTIAARQKTPPATFFAGDSTYMAQAGDPPVPDTPNTMARSLSDAMQSGSEMHGYKIDKVLGQGGFGITYRARDTKLNTYVAIKEFLPNSLAHRAADDTIQPNSENDSEIFEHLKHRFLLEAQTLAQFRHPNLVRVMAFFERANTALIVMEYEDGEGLSELLQRKQTLEEAELLGIMLPLLSGTAALHKEGFIHRDIKPGNILIRKRDNNPVLLDFGSARSVAKGNEPTSTMTSMFTPSYAPVEQYFDEASRQGPWTDVYALAAVMYHCITGERPTPSIQRGGIFFGNAEDPLPPAMVVGKGRYSEATLQAIDWGLKVRETDRPQSIEEWLVAFDRADIGRRKNSEPLPDRPIIGAPTATAPAPVSPAPPPPQKNHEQAKFLAIGMVGGLVLVFAGLAAGVWILRSGGEIQPVVITTPPPPAPPIYKTTPPPPPAPLVVQAETMPVSRQAELAPMVPVQEPPPAPALPEAVPPPALPEAVPPPAPPVVTAKVHPPVVVEQPQLPTEASPPLQPLTLELSTSRGSNQPVFHLNEVIRIVTRVNRSSYIYLFDLDSSGQAVLLYPPPGVSSRKLEPGKELQLPGPDSPFDMVVQPPYGKDTIYAIATIKPMKFNVPADGLWSDANKLRTNLRTLMQQQTEYSESQMVIITKP